jgi:tetratricopeptide (TPR) repeat protein
MAPSLATGLQLEPITLANESPPLAALRRALSDVERAEAESSTQGLWKAWLQVGCCYRALRAPTEAQNSLRQALRAARTLRSPSALVAVLCELAETTCDLADPANEPSRDLRRIARDKARDEVFEASTWLLSGEPSAGSAQLLLRLSDVLNRCGDHDDAAVLQARAVAWMSSTADH